MAKKSPAKKEAPASAPSPVADPGATVSPVKAGDAYEKIVVYFWDKLFGKRFGTWAALPMEVKNELAAANIKQLTDKDVQELFDIRHSNNKDRFRQKLQQLTQK